MTSSELRQSLQNIEIQDNDNIAPGDHVCPAQLSSGLVLVMYQSTASGHHPDSSYFDMSAVSNN